MSQLQHLYRKNNRSKNKTTDLITSNGVQHQSDQSHNDYILNLQQTLGNQAVIQMMREQTTDVGSENPTFPKMASAVHHLNASSKTVQRDPSSSKAKKNTKAKIAKSHSRMISELKDAISQNNLEAALGKFAYLESKKYLFTDLPIGAMIFGTLRIDSVAKTAKQKFDALRTISIMGSNRKKFKAMVKKYENVPGAGYEIAHRVRNIKAGNHQSVIGDRLRQEASQ